MKKIKPNKNGKRRIEVPSSLIDEILEGGEFELRQGEDFDCSPSTAGQYVRDEVRAITGWVTISTNKDDATIRVKYTPGRS